jgi:hypothetical protein
VGLVCRGEDCKPARKAFAAQPRTSNGLPMVSGIRPPANETGSCGKMNQSTPTTRRADARMGTPSLASSSESERTSDDPRPPMLSNCHRRPAVPGTAEPTRLKRPAPLVSVSATRLLSNLDSSLGKTCSPPRTICPGSASGTPLSSRTRYAVLMCDKLAAPGNSCACARVALRSSPVLSGCWFERVLVQIS